MSMTSRNEVTQQTLEQVTINSLAWQTMTRMARGDTIDMSGANVQLMNAMRHRAEQLEANGTPPKDKNDWLALALFAEDRPKFLARCEKAAQSKNLVYLSAEAWLRQITDVERKIYG
jgi:hypothetical protein